MITGFTQEVQHIRMNMEEKIKKAIIDGISPEKIQIINESYKHAGHAGDDGSEQTHFKLVVVSSKFESLNRVERQRLVNSCISNLYDEGLHALSMQLFTLNEEHT